MSAVRFELDGEVGRIVLARPEASNSFDLETAAMFGQAVSDAQSPLVRAVLVLGEGQRFCAGGDVGSMVGAADRAEYLHQLASVLDSHVQRLTALPKPVVSAVHGAVAGAGLSFVLGADVCVAARSTKFLMAYAGVGLTPDCGVSWMLPRAVGQQRALELALTGRTLTAEEARDWGLITEVVDDAMVHDRALDLAHHLAGGAVAAFGEAKRLIRSSWEATRADHAADEAATIARAVSHPDTSSLIESFVARTSSRS